MPVYDTSEQTDVEKEYTILIYCENVPGVTSSIINLFSRLGVNITSLIGASSEKDDIYRVIIKCIATSNSLDKIVKQLHKLINIINVLDSYTTEFIEYEMCLVRIYYNDKISPELYQDIYHFRGQIIYISDKAITVSFSDNPDKLKTITKMMNRFGTLEIVNSGVAVMEKEGNEFNTSYVA
ncbi:MAG: acetolactate synthase small subunit [Desulfovermiculus sp.]|nr:acetolactate synthase small subunit [Desulfovermiculus sp.]